MLKWDIQSDDESQRGLILNGVRRNYVKQGCHWQPLLQGCEIQKPSRF
ncbi:hypothetical protein [Nostoc sp.]